MKRVLIFSLFICLVAFAASFATQTRTLTMGDANMIIHDDDNIWMFPSTLYDYPEMAIGEFSDYYYYEGYGGEFYNFGMHYKFGEKSPFVLALYFDTRQPYPGFPYWLTSFDYDAVNNNRFNLFYSRMLGENKFGFHFAYLHGSYKSDVGEDIIGGPDLTEQKTDGYQFDLGLTMMEGKMDLAGGIAFMSWTDKGFNGHDTTKPDGNMMFYAQGRYFYEVDQKITLVPHGQFTYAKIASKEFGNWRADADYDQVDYKYEEKYMVLDAGLGLNYTPAAGILATGDFGVAFESEKDKDQYYEEDGGTWDTFEGKYTWFTLPYFKIGLDAVVFNWMDLRMGAVSYWNNEKDTYDYADYSYERKWSYTSNSTFLGAGFHWGNFIIDTYINPDIVLNGFNFISGEDEQMNYQVTFKYNMF